ncbi:hypothetical protein ACQY0O_005104 [Thecaphora frezii]
MSVTYHVPRSLRQPVGIVILHPSERVSRRELERYDAQWRASRDAEHARSWAEDATLVEYSPYHPRASSAAASVASGSRRRSRRNVGVSIGRGLRLRGIRVLFGNSRVR